MNSIKQEKINKIKMKINNNRNPKWKNDIHGDDDADILRMMRYDKQEQNYKKSLTQELVFIEHDIHYVLGTNIITVEHPVTRTKLKRSLVNNKTFYEGKWRTYISIKLIIDWYHSNYDLIDELIS